MSVFALGGDGSPPDADPYHDVAEQDEKERQQVAEDDIGQNEIQVLIPLARPFFQTETNLRAGREGAHQMKVKWPWNGRCQGDDPNKQDDESGTTSGDLKSHRETDGQDPVRPIQNNYNEYVSRVRTPIALLSTRLIVSWQYLVDYCQSARENITFH